MEKFMNQNNKNKLLAVIILLLVISLDLNAQYSAEFNAFKLKYPESSLIRLNDELVITVQLKNDALEIKQSFIEEDLYLDETATYGSKRALNFSSFFELESIEATSYQYKNGKYIDFEVEEFTEKDELDNSFHDDTKSLNFIFPNLSEGGKTKLEYTEIVKNPRFLSPIYFGDFFPIKKKKVTLIASKDIEFKFKAFNTESYNISFNKKEKRGNYIYTWEILDVDKLEYEEDIPTYKNVLPHIIPIISSYKSNGKKVNVLDTVSDLYNWYYSLVKDVNLDNPDSELVALVNELIKDKETDLDRVKAIYYWTQQNIKYIDFEFALGGFIPREANDVFKKKYGDCKDNSSILFEMLNIANLKGDLTWIGTRTIPYTYNEVPTPIVDNHMILSYSDTNQTYFLDATGRYLSIEMPSSFIQGKEALVSDGKDNFEIKKVPIMSPETNTFKDNTVLNLEGDNLIGESTTEISGYYKMDFFNQLEDVNTDAKLKDYYNRKLRKGNNKFLIDNFKETNKFDYENNLEINYSFNIRDYIIILKDEIYINLNLNKNLSHYKTEEDRKNDIEFKYKSLYDFTTTLNIPEGYLVDYMPENYSVSNEFFNCEITYKRNDQSVTYTQITKMNYLTLDPAEQKIVNDAIKKVEKNFKEIVVLKKK